MVCGMGGERFEKEEALKRGERKNDGRERERGGGETEDRYRRLRISLAKKDFIWPHCAGSKPMGCN